MIDLSTLTVTDLMQLQQAINTELEVRQNEAEIDAYIDSLSGEM